MILLSIGLGAYLFKLWRDDYRAAKSGSPHPKALPGATTASKSAIVIAVVGAVALVALATGGEYALGTVGEQSTVTWLFLLAMIAAGFYEELFFRGFLVVQKKGALILWGSIVGFSLLFSLFHVQYYLEKPEDMAWTDFGRYGEATLKVTAQSIWTLLMLFANSVWFYTVRFWRLNPQQSLIPCFAAHIASNLAVFVIKLVQGHVGGLW